MIEEQALLDKLEYHLECVVNDMLGGPQTVIRHHAELALFAIKHYYKQRDCDHELKFVSGDMDYLRCKHCGLEGHYQEIEG